MVLYALLNTFIVCGHCPDFKGLYDLLGPCGVSGKCVTNKNCSMASNKLISEKFRCGRKSAYKTTISISFIPVDDVSPMMVHCILVEVGS